jgi:hypothetical protein
MPSLGFTKVFRVFLQQGDVTSGLLELENSCDNK